MSSEDLRQLSDLLSALNSVNGAKSQIRVGEAVIYSNDTPIAQLSSDEKGDLVLIRLINKD